MPKLKDITGKRFTKLTVIKQNGYIPGRCAVWICRCDCGKEVQVRSDLLKSGNNKSCGCLLREWSKSGTCNKSHGLYKTSEYKIWQHAKARCHCKNHKAYKDYGGRGIKMCKTWQSSFNQFLKDMGPRPTTNHSIDRINNNGNYEPSNCRWATVAEQHRNKRNNVFLEHNGERLCISDWAKKIGWSTTAIRKWSKRGMPISAIIERIKWKR